MSNVDVVITFINLLATILTLAILIRALLSWFMPAGGGGLMTILFDITEPILGPIRRVLPPVGGIDFSPILAMVLIQIVSYALQSLLSSSA